MLNLQLRGFISDTRGSAARVEVLVPRSRTMLRAHRACSLDHLSVSVYSKFKTISLHAAHKKITYILRRTFSNLSKAMSNSLVRFIKGVYK